MISPPNSIHDSKSLNTSSSSASTSPNNSILLNNPSTSQTIVASNCDLKVQSRYYESILNTPNSGSTPTNNSLLTANSSYSTSPSSLSSLSHSNNNSNRSLQISFTDSTQHNEILNKIDESFRWIRAKQNKLNTIQFKPDLTQIKLNLDCLINLQQELQFYKTNIEFIELLRMQLNDTPELTCKINTLNEEYHYLCAFTATIHNNLEDLNEFIRSVHDELHFINEMEDIELNRDWSQPGKLKLNELIQHKKVFL